MGALNRNIKLNGGLSSQPGITRGHSHSPCLLQINPKFHPLSSICFWFNLLHPNSIAIFPQISIRFSQLWPTLNPKWCWPRPKNPASEITGIIQQPEILSLDHYGGQTGQNLETLESTGVSWICFIGIFQKGIDTIYSLWDKYDWGIWLIVICLSWDWMGHNSRFLESEWSQCI